MDNNEAWRTIKAMFPISSQSSVLPKPVFSQTPDTSQPYEGWTSLKLRLLLNARQMVSEDYPIPLPGLQENYKDYVFTRDEYVEVG